MSADFSGIIVWRIDEIEARIADGSKFVQVHLKESHCDPKLLERLRYGIFGSEHTEEKFQNYARRIWGDKYDTEPPKNLFDEEDWF